jgi:hypothetical protein
MFKPRHLRQAPNTIPSDRSSEVIPDTRVQSKATRIASTAAIPDKLVRPKKMVAPYQPPEPKLLELTEVPNTPSQRSSQLDSSIPKKSFEHLRDAYVPQERYSAHEDDDALALGGPRHVQDWAPSTAPCSTCRKQTALAKPGDEGIQWYVHILSKSDISNGFIVPAVAPDYVLRKQGSWKYPRLQVSTMLVTVHRYYQQSHRAQSRVPQLRHLKILKW